MDESRRIAADCAWIVALLRPPPVGAGEPPPTLDTLAREALERHGGRVDAEEAATVFYGFRTPEAAVNFGTEIERRVLEQSPDGPVPSLGIHRRDGRHGDAAGVGNEARRIACRLAHFAHGGGIVASGAALAAMQSPPPRTMRPAGTLTPRPGAEPLEVFRAEAVISPHGVRGPGEILCFGAYELDTLLFELREHGVRVPVEPMTFDLLSLLARNAHRTVSRDEVFQALWGDRIVSDAALSSQVKAARRAVGDDGSAQHTIATVHGRGFRFVREPTYDGPAQTNLTPRTSSAERLSGGKPVVAVLPLADLDQAGRQDNFADCLTEELITWLAKNRCLAVIARNPAFSFRNSDAPLSEIGAELGAGYLVTGSVRRGNGSVRISVQLANARSGFCIWAERLTRELTDIFALVEKVSALISSRLTTELGLAEQRRARAQAPGTLGAWEHYQLGSAEFYRFTADGNQRCRDFLQQAIAQDPEFAAAHSRLAYAMVLDMLYFEGALEQARLDKALEIARNAVALDDQDANSYFVLGRVHLARCEYAAAIAALERGLELNPCLALVHCGLGESFAFESQFNKAFGHFDAAVELSPHDPFRWAFFSYRSLAHLFVSDFAAAAYWARRATEVPNAHYWARAHLVAALGHLGDAEQVKRERAELLRLRPGFTRALAKERMFYVKKREQLGMYLAGLARAGIE